MRQSHDGTDDEFKAMSPQEQLQELKRLRKVAPGEFHFLINRSDFLKRLEQLEKMLKNC